MNIVKLFQEIDHYLFGLILIIITLGLFTLASSDQSGAALVVSQIINIIIGITLMFAVILMGPKKLFFFAPFLYIASLFLLLFVVFFGYESHGAQRWINLGFLKFQPSEVIKLTTPLMLAWHYAKNDADITLKQHLLALLIITIPFFLIFIQPDLGTALMISFVGLVIIFVAGLPIKFISISFILFLLSSPFLWGILEPYQQKRIMTLFDPFSDALGSGYQTIQSMIALGSGGLIGKGWGNATQTYLDFLPESSTDFIFAVFSEEFGFLGVISALILYLLIFYRCMFMVTRMQDTFSRILSLGILMSLFFGLIINLGMISGILPIVGVPLPLFSYGGTSMVVSLISIGIIMTLYNNKTLIAN